MSIYSFLSDNYQIEVKNKKLMEDAFTHASYLNETKSLNNCYALVRNSKRTFYFIT